MKNSFRYASIFTLSFGLFTGAIAGEEEFKLTGNVQTQASKAFYDNDSDNNLDGFWFRSNFGGKYTSDNFDGQVTIRMYGPKFGNTIDEKNYDKFQADTYWGNYKWALGDNKVNLKLGHWKTDWSVSGNFGTYVDPNLSTRGFLARDYSHDAFELGWATGPSTFSAMLATNDSKFNTGYIRLEENLKLGKPFEIGAAYRVNAIDVITNTAVLTHRAAAKASFTVMPSLRVYGEAAMIVTGTNDDLATAPNAVKPEYAEDTNYFPFFVGLEIPTAGLLNNLFVEMEYIGDREDFKKDADNMAWTVAAVKKLGDKTKAQFSVYSENKIKDVAAALRISTTIQ